MKQKPPPCDRYPTIHAWIAHTLPIKIYILAGYAYKFAALTAIITLIASIITSQSFSPDYDAIPIGAAIGTVIGIITIELAYYIHKEECSSECRKPMRRYYSNKTPANIKPASK